MPGCVVEAQKLSGQELRDTTNPRLALIVLNLQALVVVEQLWRVLHILDLLLKVWFNCCWLDGGLLLEDGAAHGCGKSQHKAKETDLQRSGTLGIFLEETLALELVHYYGYHHHARRRHANPTEDNHGDALPRSNLRLPNLLAFSAFQHDPVCEFCSSHERDVDAVAGSHRHEGHQPANQGWQIFHRCVETKSCSQGSSCGSHIGGAQGGDRDGHIA